MTVEQLYRHIDGGDDWEEHTELDRHVETNGSYEMRCSEPTDTMPEGVIVVRDIGGDVSSFMVPDTRLQEIADAWNEYKEVMDSPRTLDEMGDAEDKVYALLDALTDDNAQTPRQRWGTCCPNDPECEHSFLDADELTEHMDAPIKEER